MSNATMKRLRASLEKMRVPDLQQRFAEATGTTTRSPNKKFLIQRIVEATGVAMRAVPESSEEPTAPVAEPVEPEEHIREEAGPEREPGEEELSPYVPIAVETEPLPAEPASREIAEAEASHADPPQDETGLLAEAASEGEISHRECEAMSTATLESPEPTEVQHAEIAPADEPERLPDIAASEPSLAPTAASPTHDTEGAGAEAVVATTGPDEPLRGEAIVEQATEASQTTPTRLPRGALTGLTIEELQAKYAEVVGRSTGSSDKAYLQWKIREAVKGKIPVGPRSHGRRTSHGEDIMVLPLRMAATMVDAMDTAWRTRGIRTRMDFLREAIRLHLERLGAHEAAALLVRAEAEQTEEAL